MQCGVTVYDFSHVGVLPLPESGHVSQTSNVLINFALNLALLIMAFPSLGCYNYMHSHSCSITATSMSPWSHVPC